MKRGRKPTPGITAGLYFDYCLGMSIPEVAEKWAMTEKAVRSRLNAMKLPLRKQPTCKCRFRNPHNVTGLSFEDANRERTRLANQFMVDRARAALPLTTSAKERQTLLLRITYPEASLSELAALHQPPVTKDAVSGALRRAGAKVEAA